jgi:hypothetical protein
VSSARALEATIQHGRWKGRKRRERDELTKVTTKGGDSSGTTANAEGADGRFGGRCRATGAVLRVKLEWRGQQGSAETGSAPFY